VSLLNRMLSQTLHQSRTNHAGMSRIIGCRLPYRFVEGIQSYPDTRSRRLNAVQNKTGAHGPGFHFCMEA
ncbi:MAG: hypothetical protein ACYC2V_13015, partial [Thiobacillus sp.]